MGVMYLEYISWVSAVENFQSFYIWNTWTSYSFPLLTGRIAFALLSSLYSLLKVSIMFTLHNDFNLDPEGKIFKDIWNMGTNYMENKFYFYEMNGSEATFICFDFYSELDKFGLFFISLLPQTIKIFRFYILLQE